MKKPKFEVYMNVAFEWCWRLRSANGRIVAVGEGYTREQDAKRAVRTVIATAKAAKGEL